MAPEPIRYKPRKEKLHVDDPGLLEMITKLASRLSLTKNHIADILNVGRSTFYQFLKDNPAADEAFRRGRAAGRLTHAELLDLHAQTHAPTAMFLAKQDRYLGMSDNPKADKAVAQIAEAETQARRSREELLARAAELLRKVPIDIDGEAEEVQPEANHVKRGRAVARRG